MSHSLGAFVSRDLFELERLRELPVGIGYAAYRDVGGSLLVVDTFAQGKRPEYPFQGPCLSGYPLDDADATLAAFYEFLRSSFMAASFSRRLVNATLAMSRLVGVPVLAFVTNDDDLDFTCIATRGEVNRIAALLGSALRATWADGRLTVEPLVPEEQLEEEGEQDGIDLEALARAVPGITIRSEPVVWSFMVHGQAAAEFEAFTQRPRSLVGLDGDPIDPRAFEVVAQR